MELEGTVWNVLPPVRGTSARGEWVKQEVVFEQPGEFNRKVCVSFWGDKAQDAATLKPGEAVTISANVESREYNGRWFTEVRAWRIVRKAAQQPQQAPVSDAVSYTHLGIASSRPSSNRPSPMNGLIVR